MTARDAGLATERSWLSWQRTELSALAATGVLVKLGLTRDNPAELGAAAALAVVTVALWVGRGLRRRSLARMHLGILRAVTGLTVLAAAFVAAAVW